jgi:hypothetical protein
LASAPSKVSKVSKGLAAHLKYCYGACIKRNQHLPATDLSQKVHNILQHICGIHDGCDVAWCYDLKAKERNKACNPPKEHRINEDADPNTYLQLKKIFDQYASVEQMAYCNHPFDTQTNESLNNSIATVAPKTTCYSGTISLFSRIAIVIGLHNYGYVTYFEKLFSNLGMTMSTTLLKFLQGREDKKEVKRRYQRRLDIKAHRSKKQKKSIEQVLKERVDNSYGPGIGLNAGISKKRKAADATEQENAPKQNKTCKCGSTTHRRTTHRECPLRRAPNPPQPPPPPPPPNNQPTTPALPPALPPEALPKAAPQPPLSQSAQRATAPTALLSQCAPRHPPTLAALQQPNIAALAPNNIPVITPAPTLAWTPLSSILRKLPIQNNAGDGWKNNEVPD